MKYINIAILTIVLVIGILYTATPTIAEINWSGDPFEELRNEYFMNQSPINNILDDALTFNCESEITTPDSTLALCFEYNNGSHVIIPIDEPELTNVSLQVNGEEIAKYPTIDILKVVRRERKDIIERLKAS